MKIFQDPNNPDYSWKPPTFALIALMVLSMAFHDAEAAERSERVVVGTQNFNIDPGCETGYRNAINKVADEFSRMSVPFIGRINNVFGHLEANQRNDVYCSDVAIQNALTIAPEGMGFEDHELIVEEGQSAIGIARQWYYTHDPEITIEWDIWLSTEARLDQREPVVWHEFGHVAGLSHSDYILDLMYASLWVNGPTLDDIERVITRYGVCDNTFYTKDFKELLIPRIVYKGDEVQLRMRLIEGVSFDAIEIKNSVCN